MNQIYYILENQGHDYFIIFFLFFLLGWLINKIYKLLFFFWFIFFGKLGEKKAKKLLINNGYEILDEQHTLKGYLLENKEKRTFFMKPDFFVKKNDIVYVVEVKTGETASITNRNTRRQLLEYTTSINSKKALLVNVDKKTISHIEFL